ncbi:hypothetical protein K1T71_012691 [Dendrolimus kikuchii]|uniref:Uncharacterized protein n=1 Tax=Dendrolimus kikuchii TaxID=765133 RepID=A0ACC1CK46_9NEOP|nr:hypothetical protein K1T71_012691 [Dendrolimus kikuchii]
MACCSGVMAAPRVAPLAAILAALLAAASSRVPTQEPAQFEAAFQGRCGEGSPCEQLCRELHDGTYECGCGPGFVLQVDGYGCLVPIQSFSAELEIAPSNRFNKPTISIKHIDDDKRLTTLPAAESGTKLPNYTFTGERSKEVNGLKSLIEDGVSKTDLNIIADDDKEELAEAVKVTTQGPSLEQKVPGATMSPPWTAAVDTCNCDSCNGDHCSCPHASHKCRSDMKIMTPRFSGSSWVALRALRGAYKRVRVRVRVRPERARGVLLLTGEHDDLSGDYLALLLRNGHVELRAHSVLRSGSWFLLGLGLNSFDNWIPNRWYLPTIFSIEIWGLFSRMTFREPVWIGGAGNTTGLTTKLGLSDGLLGCVDFLRINGDTYRLVKDAIATLDIGECAPTLAPWKPNNEVTTREAAQNQNEDTHGIYDINDIVHFEDNDIVMRDSKIIYQDHNKLDNSVDLYDLVNNIEHVRKTQTSDKIENIDSDARIGDNKTKEDKDELCECQHGGGCVNRVCLCPLGYAGVKCEITLDLKVPRFNGSSYLRLPGLGSSAQSWLDVQMTVKPTNSDGLLLYNSEHASGDGDFFSLHIRDYFVEFAFDLGSGIALVRSPMCLTYRANLDKRGGYTVRSSIMGGPSPAVGHSLALVINDEDISVVSSALGGLNVDNCEEPTNNSCTNNTCKEILQPIPEYPQNLSTYDIHHTIVAKKGFKQKYHKKTKKHVQHYHVEKIKKRYFVKKNHFYSTNDVIDKSDVDRNEVISSSDVSNDVLTEGPVYDGQTYMQVKYLNPNEINWGDTNSYPSFSGTDSFIHIDDEETMKRLLSYTLDINIRFRSVSANGLLVWSGRSTLSPPGDFLSLAVENSVLVFRYDLGSGEVFIVANHTKVDDGLWHRARATRNRQAGVLEVDGLGSVGKISPGKHKQLNTENGLYIGGLPSIEMNTMGKYKNGLVGCVSQISLSGDFDIPLSLSKLPHTITNNVGRCTP